MSEQIQKEEALEAIANELPPIVFRNWAKWRHVLPMAPRTVANDDSKGLGPANRIYVGRNCGYPRADFIQYLRTRMRVTPNPTVEAEKCE